ncbi:putative aarF domain-containing protein kinase, chloroplastic [Glycine max]|nr:putative aarF domain-containing protein kinase, chloroplastic [Glycine max]
MAVSGLRSGGLPLFHHHHHHHHLRFLQSPPSFAKLSFLGSKSSKKGFTVFSRYAQARDLFSSRRFQDSMEKLPNLVEDIVQTSLNTGPRGVLRLAQGVQAFLGVGQEWLTDVSKSANSFAGLPTELQLGLLSPFYLRRLFERMGATYIKLGQEIESILRKELGKPLESVYEYIDPTPIASASIAQVHGARLKGSREDVVIKVLKPGIEDILVADLNFVYVVARILEFLSPEISRTSLVGIVKDIRESMLEEVDFYKEAANIEAFRRYLETMGLTGNATAPKVYRYCSTMKVLTMQRLYGVPLTDLDSISSLVSNPETSLITALNMYMQEICGFYVMAVLGFLTSELDTEIVVATTTGTATNATAVAANIVVDERQMNALFLDVVRVSESYGLKFPREFALLLKQLLYFDRYTRLLAPNLNMLQDQRISIASNSRSRV